MPCETAHCAAREVRFKMGARAGRTEFAARATSEVRCADALIGNPIGRWLEMCADSLIRSPRLTGVEMWILRESARGTSNKEIALRLFVYESTVRERLRHIRRQIGAGTRAEAAAWLRKQQEVGMFEDVLDPLEELRGRRAVDHPVVERQGQHHRGPNLDAIANGNGFAVQAAHA